MRDRMIRSKKTWGLACMAGVGALVLFLGQEGHAQEDEAAAAPVGKDANVVRFGHELHKGKGVKVDNCKTCHSIKGEYEVEPVTRGKDHQPCNNSGCHAAEYMSREPKICVVCHDTNEPWVKQTARIRDFDVSEFGGEISHKTHQSNKAREGGIKCQSCHGDVFNDGEKPDSHAVCGSCHQGGLEPVMSDCGSCHMLGRAAELRKSDSRYTVRGRFEHSDHERDPREKKRAEPSCKVCHTGISDAESLSDIPSPTMKSCDSCHDGKLAFKTTGFDCVKCHGDAAP